MKIEGKKEGLITYDLKTGNWMRTVVDGSTVGSAQPYEDIFRYPLEVGKKFQSEYFYFDYTISGKGSTNVNVLSFAEVHVPAGTFMAYQITAEQFVNMSGNMTAGIPSYRHLKRLWYSPDLKIIIKIEDRDNRESHVTKTELLEYSEP